jgi:hypothetical protein
MVKAVHAAYGAPVLAALEAEASARAVAATRTGLSRTGLSHTGRRHSS